ncbi:MAG: hypothetical protein IPN38_17300 [Flavobacteriales bacterium]|nr:hypothetical protein [Flavobacteriales bacterium]
MAPVGATVNNYPGTVTFTWPELNPPRDPVLSTWPVTSNQATAIASNGCGQSLTGLVTITMEVLPTKAVALPGDRRRLLAADGDHARQPDHRAKR